MPTAVLHTKDTRPYVHGPACIMSEPYLCALGWGGAREGTLFSIVRLLFLKQALLGGVFTFPEEPYWKVRISRCLADPILA